MELVQASTRNILLRTMAAGDYELLAPALVRIPLPVQLKLHEAGQDIESIYFPEGGVVSIVAVTLDGDACEVGLFGREGMSETAIVLGTDRSRFDAFVQIHGASALQLPVRALVAAFAASPTLRQHLLRYVQAMMIQLSSSIAAAGQTIEQRLARWFLMCHDRVDGDNLRLTHELVGMMLNVRRAGVSGAVAALSDAGLIASRRGAIEVCDRAGLERLAAGSYGLAEYEYARLMGVDLRRPTADRRPDTSG